MKSVCPNPDIGLQKTGLGGESDNNQGYGGLEGQEMY